MGVLQAPDFPVEKYAQPWHTLHINLLIAAVVAQTLEEESTLWLREELGILRKTWDNHKGNGAEGNGDETLDDEDPSPGFIACESTHVLESERKETTTSTAPKSETDEPCEADIELAALVVLTDK